MGYCTFEIKKSKTNFLVQSEIALDFTIPQTVIKEKSIYSLNMIPEKYFVDIKLPRGKRIIDTSFKSGKVNLTETFNENKAEKEWEIKPGFEILDNNVVDHWYIILKKFYGGEKDSAEIETVVPSLKGNYKITLQKSGFEEIEVEHKKYNAFKIEGRLVLGQVKFTGWVEVETGDLIRFSTPEQHFEMVPSKELIPFSKEETTEVEAEAEKIEEKYPYEEVEFGIEKWKVRGKLSFPEEKKDRYPALVLVHGSGPNDEDETIGPNKPFKDIADGLNRRGFTVLRYKKRTNAYGPLLDVKTLTLYEETIQDAVEAVKYLSHRNDIDKNNVFLLGHSLGATAAPLIASKTTALKGTILAAGSARPILDVVSDQIRHKCETAGYTEDYTQKEVNKIKESYYNVLKSDYDKLKTWIGLTRTYLEDFNSLDPVGELVKSHIPALIIQGEKDYQVLLKDFEIWKSAVKESGKDNVTFRSFPDLNHLFMKVEGVSTGAEYLVPGHIETEVLEYIADWMKRLN